MSLRVIFREFYEINYLILKFENNVHHTMWLWKFLWNFSDIWVIIYEFPKFVWIMEIHLIKAKLNRAI